MKRTFKKVLSVVLALAMVVTSMTVSKSTAKAADITVEVTAEADDGKLKASWTKPEGLVQDSKDEDDNWIAGSGDYAKLAYYLNYADDIVLDDNHLARASNDWVWSQANPTEDRTAISTVVSTKDRSLNITDGGDFVITVQYIAADGTVVAEGTSNAVTFEKVVNRDLNLKVERYENKVAYLKWALIAGAVKYEVYNADTNELIKTSNSATTDWTNVSIEQGIVYNFVVKAIDADGNEIEITNNTTTAYQENFNVALGVVYGTGTATLSWEAITGAANYVVVVNNEEVATVTDKTYTMDVVEKTVYNVVVKAVNAEGVDIEVTNNTKEVEYVAEGAPAEHDITKVDTSVWNKLSVKAGSSDNEYYINGAHGLSQAVWYGIYAPHSGAAYHGDRTNCVLGDAASFTFQQSNIKEIWVNGNKYANPSTTFNNQGDCAEISVNVLTEKENVITLVLNDGTMKTFAIQVKAEEVPDTSAVDTSAWTVIPNKGTDSANIVNTYSINTAGYETYVNTAIWGVFAPASSTSYHGGTCNIVGAAIGFAIKNNSNAGTVWVDGVKYLAGSEYVHVRNDSVEIALSLFETPGIHYVSVVGGSVSSFAIQTVAPQAEVAPDQTLTEVTDWIMVGPSDASVSVNEYSYYVSEAFRNANINHVDLFGLYTDHTTSPYHQAGCTLTGAAYVSSYPALSGTIKSVWVDGVKYTSGTTDCYIEGDQVHLSQSIFAEKKTYAITVRTATADVTYALKVEDAVKYTVTVDGSSESVLAGAEYTLGDAVNGYVCGDEAYKAGSTVTVNSDMAFTSIGDVTVTAEKGAGIRYQGTAGIRFQAKVNAKDDVLNSAAVKTGMIITANDIYEAHGSELDLDVIGDNYAALNVPNTGWYEGQTGTFCGSIVNIADSNYIRNFIAKAYVTITYTDGTTETVYSNMTGARSIKDVAQLVKEAGYVGIEEAYHEVIDAYAAAK